MTNVLLTDKEIRAIVTSIDFTYKYITINLDIKEELNNQKIDLINTLLEILEKLDEDGV